MNLWTFLDRNGGGIVFVIVIGLCFAFGTCGDHTNREGCRVQCGTAVMSVGPVDAGGDQ